MNNFNTINSYQQRFFHSPENSFDSLSTLTLFNDSTQHINKNNNQDSKSQKGDLICNKTFGCLQNVGHKRFGFVRPNKLSEGVLFHFSDALPGSSPTSWNCVYPVELPCRLEFSLYKRSIIDKNDYDIHPYSVSNVGPIRYSVGRILNESTLENLDSFQILTYRQQDLMNRVKPSSPLQPGQMILFFLEEGENSEVKPKLITPCERATINHLSHDAQFPYGFVTTRFTDPLDSITQSFITAKLGPSVQVLTELYQQKKPFFTSLQELKVGQRTTCWDCFVERQSTFLLSSDGETAELSWFVHSSGTPLKTTIRTDRDLPISLLRRASVEKLIIRHFFLIHAVLPVGAVCNVSLNDEGKLILDGTQQIINDPKKVFDLMKQSGDSIFTKSGSNFKAVVNWNKSELNLVSIQSQSINQSSSSTLPTLPTHSPQLSQLTQTSDKRSIFDNIFIGEEIANGVRKGVYVDSNQPIIIKIIPLTQIHQIQKYSQDPSIISPIDQKQDQTNVYLLFKQYSGTFLDLLKRPLKDRVQALKSLFRCVSDLHSRMKYHENIAPHAIYYNQDELTNEFEIILGQNFSIANRWNESINFDISDKIEIVTKAKQSKDIYALGLITAHILSGGKLVHENNQVSHEYHTCLCNFDKRYHLSNDLTSLLPGSNELISAMINPIIQNRPSISSLLSSPLFWTEMGSLKFIIKVFKLAKRSPELKTSINSYPPPWNTSCWHDLIPADEFPEMRQIAESYNGTDCYNLLMFLSNLYGRSIDEQLLPEEARVIYFFPTLLSHIYHSFSTYRNSLESTLQEMDNLLNTVLIFNHTHLSAST